MMRDAWMEVLPPVDHYCSRSNWFLGTTPARGWTPEENKQFEKALAGLDLRAPDWEKVAQAIPGKTVGDIVNHYNDLELDVRQIESGLVPFPVYGGNGFKMDWEVNGNGGGAGGFGEFRQGYCVGGGGGGKRHGSRTLEQERKKGVPWTEEEHKLFLLGLKKYGKGDWRNISRNFVQTRTPTQVASHAQKYFIRLNSGGKDKRRSSIHDITTVNLTDDRPPSPSQSSLLSSQSNASTPSAAGGQFSLMIDAKQHGAVNAPFNSPARTFGMTAYGMSLQDQGLQRGPHHDPLVGGNRNMLFQMQSTQHHG